MNPSKSRPKNPPSNLCTGARVTRTYAITSGILCIIRCHWTPSDANSVNAEVHLELHGFLEGHRDGMQGRATALLTKALEPHRSVEKSHPPLTAETVNVWRDFRPKTDELTFAQSVSGLCEAIAEQLRTHLL